MRKPLFAAFLSMLLFAAAGCGDVHSPAFDRAIDAIQSTMPDTIHSLEDLELLDHFNVSEGNILEIEWSSSEPSIVSDQGIVFASEGYSGVITMTAKLIFEGKEITRDFMIDLDIPDQFEIVFAYLSSIVPTRIDQPIDIELPETTNQPPSSIDWVSSTPGVMDETGTLIAQSDINETIVLTAKVRIKDIEKTKEFPIEIHLVDPFESVATLLRSIVPAFVETVGYLDLPDSLEAQGASIQWVSSNTRRITDAGEVVSIGESDIDVLLTAVVTIGEETRFFPIPVRVLADKEYLFTVAEEYLRYYINTTVSRNLRLYHAYPGYESTVVYESSHPEVLGDDGTYTKTDRDTLVGLTVSVTIRNETRSFVVDILVIGLTDYEKVHAIGDWVKEYLDELEITPIVDLPLTHPIHKGVIEWMTYDVGIIEQGSKLIQPSWTKNVQLIIEVRVHFSKLTIYYEKELEGNQSMTEGEWMDAWILRNIASDMNQVYNLVDGKGILVTKVLLDPAAPFYTSLTGGLMRVPTQADLDARFHPGYQKPNPENILWITVHETGNTNNTATALAHSNLQVNRSLNGWGSSSPASWHYTVDDKSVYQNIPDTRRAIHAGDGASAGTGNSNGIGIEMCVNGTGNYEVSMLNNAKLIAQLMHEYHLTLMNVRQHNFFSGKNCPEIMRGTNRWFEFLDMISLEYQAMEIFRNATVTWTVPPNPHVARFASTNVLTVTNRPLVDTVVTLTLEVDAPNFSKTYSIDVIVKGIQG